MDRDWFLGAFVVAAVVGLLIARWFVRRVGAWQVLREAEADRWSRVYVLGAVVVLLWVGTALISQIVSTGAYAASQVFAFSDNFASAPRIYIFSIANGTAMGIQLGIALGLVRYVLRVVREVGDGDSSEGGEVDWSRPADGGEGRSEGGVGAAGGGVRVQPVFDVGALLACSGVGLAGQRCFGTDAAGSDVPAITSTASR